MNQMTSYSKLIFRTSDFQLTKEKIREHINQTSELPDQDQIAEELRVDRAVVDSAYEALVEEGVVDRETYDIFKNPETRKCLFAAMRDEKEISLDAVREKFGL